MPIPDYQSVMLPLLQHLADGHECTRSHSEEAIVEHFRVTPEERLLVIPSGRSTLIRSRVGWGRTYLLKAGLLTRIRRGIVTIAPRGLEVLSEHPERVDNALLRRFPEFVEFLSPSLPAGADPVIESVDADASPALPPEEVMAGAHKSLNERLAGEILRRLHVSDPAFFEQVVVDVLVSMGYGGSRHDAAQVVGRSGDEGIDGVIKEDRLGLDVVYVQAKRWQESVGRPELMKFVGALQGKKARKGVFFTTSDFTREAREYVRHLESSVVLVDGGALAGLMIEHGVGVSTVDRYEVKRLDLDYFEEE